MPRAHASLNIPLVASSGLQVWMARDAGKGAAASALPMNSAMVVQQDVEQARKQGLILANPLHLLFLAAPLENPPGWPANMPQDFRAVYERLKEDERLVCERVGITPYFVQSSMAAPSNRSASYAAYREQARLCARMYHAWVLADIIEEVLLDVICAKYRQDRGWVQALQDRSGRMAAAVSALCDSMGFEDIHKLLAVLQDRILAGARTEILALTAISCIKAPRARVLYRAGFCTVDALAKARPDKLVEALQAGHNGKGPNIERHLKGLARRILCAANELVSERVRAMRDQLEEAQAALGGVATPSAAVAAAALAAVTGGAAGQMVVVSPAGALLSAGPSSARAPPGLSPAGVEAAHASAAAAAAAAAAEVANAAARAKALTAAVAAAARVVNPVPPPLPAPPAAPHVGAVDEAAVAAAWAAQQEPATGTLIVTGAAAFEALRRRWSASHGYAFAVAWHPAGHEHRDGPGPRARGVAVTFDGRRVFYVPFDGAAGEVVRAACAALLAAPGALKASIDIKEQVQALACRAPPQDATAACMSALGAPFEDVRVMAWLLSPGDEALFQATKPESNALDPLNVLKRIGVLTEPVVRAAAASGAACPSLAASVAARAAAAAHAAAAKLRPLLREKDLMRPLHELEMPLVPALAAMEKGGMAFSASAMNAQIAPVERRLTELERRVRGLANLPRLQLSSNAEVAAALFGSLGFVPPETARLAPSRTGRKQGQTFSVSAAVLQDLRASDARAAPIVDAILEQRQLSKSVACVPLAGLCVCTRVVRLSVCCGFCR
jgi:hypothetical protein